MHEGINNITSPNVYRAEVGTSWFTPGLSGWKPQEAAEAGICSRHLNVPGTLFLKGLGLSDSNLQMRKQTIEGAATCPGFTASP